jgi:hypothetical protein
VASKVNGLIDPPAAPLTCTTKLRYRHNPTPATVTATADPAWVPAATTGTAAAPAMPTAASTSTTPGAGRACLSLLIDPMSAG